MIWNVTRNPLLIALGVTASCLLLFPARALPSESDRMLSRPTSPSVSPLVPYLTPRLSRAPPCVSDHRSGLGVQQLSRGPGGGAAPPAPAASGRPRVQVPGTWSPSPAPGPAADNSVTLLQHGGAATVALHLQNPQCVWTVCQPDGRWPQAELGQHAPVQLLRDGSSSGFFLPQGADLLSCGIRQHRMQQFSKFLQPFQLLHCMLQDHKQGRSGLHWFWTRCLWNPACCIFFPREEVRGWEPGLCSSHWGEQVSLSWTGDEQLELHRPELQNQQDPKHLPSGLQSVLVVCGEAGCSERRTGEGVCYNCWREGRVSLYLGSKTGSYEVHPRYHGHFLPQA